MRRLKQFTVLFLVVLLVFSFSSCKTKSQTGTLSTIDDDAPSKAEESQHTDNITIFSNNDFWIKFIDVGQGDSALVCCDHHYMLIDAGPVGNGKAVKDTLENYGVFALDYLIISHMDEDHFGGLKEALNGVVFVENIFSVEKKDYNSKNYDKVKDMLMESGKKFNIVVPKSNQYYLGEAVIEIISVGDIVENENQNDFHNNSLVILVTYKETNFLFTGDMPKEQGKEVIEKLGKKPPITLLKVAHHGALKENQDIIEKLKPQYAVISVGEDNEYGHPNNDLLRKFKKLKTKVYRTDQDGSILVESNGKKITKIGTQ